MKTDDLLAYYQRFVSKIPADLLMAVRKEYLKMRPNYPDADFAKELMILADAMGRVAARQRKQ